MHLVKNRNTEIAHICRAIPNVAFLHRHVVIINGVAILGANGWYGTKPDLSTALERLHLHSQHVEDVSYIGSSIEKIQLYLDVKKIVVVTHCAPSPGLFFGEEPPELDDQIPLTQTLGNDSERKVCTWIYGSYNKNVYTTIDDITYINNSYYHREPYWAKRFEVEV